MLNLSKKKYKVNQLQFTSVYTVRQQLPILYCNCVLYIAITVQYLLFVSSVGRVV